MNTKKIISLTTGLALAASIAIPAFAFAQTNIGANVNTNVGWQGQGQWQGQGNGTFVPGQPGQHMPGKFGTSTRSGIMKPGVMRPGVMGTVTAVNGNTITVSGRQGFGTTTSTVTYTVDATNATVKKANATSTVSSIAIGDRIFAIGTVSGTNVTATMIMDSVMMGPGMGQNRGGQNQASSTPAFVGNGQPVIAGKVSAINGSSLTVTTANASNVTYTVDASNAKILQNATAATLSNIVVGDNVLVQGSISGTAVTASTVIDQSSQPTPANSTQPGQKPASHGFLGGIGQFFMHLFGF